VDETMVQRYSQEFDSALRKHYKVEEPGLQFFVVHKSVDEDHIKMAAEIIAQYADAPTMKELVRQMAQYAVRFKLGKFDGIYRHYCWAIKILERIKISVRLCNG
jgi:pyrroloquinoline quinone (PQQ) biosynthesis protein C